MVLIGLFQSYYDCHLLSKYCRLLKIFSSNYFIVHICDHKFDVGLNLIQK